uniref:Acetyl-CoA hydratase/transferase n=1 Tax=Pseudomonas sp. 19-rlim TaxID=1084570 RepID=G3LGT9_9PSED|nr:acetyl-CoA hydratase/transferase [Pseudomonas sp. 19-rlim]
MPTKRTLDAVVTSLRPGMNIYVPGVSGESLAFYQALQANPEACSGVRFIGAHFPGINHSDYIGLHQTARQRNYFMLPGLRQGFAGGRAELLPLDYQGIYRDLAGMDDIDIAIVQVSPPDEHGICSLGPCQDFIPAVWSRARQRVAHVNPSLPRTRGAFSIRWDEIDIACDAQWEVLSYDNGQPTDLQNRIAAHVTDLVRDGDTIELGIGKIQSAIISSLKSHQNLSIYSGMVMAPILELIDTGVIKGPESIQIGVALGSGDFYQRTAEDPSFFYRPVGDTHDPCKIAAIANFCAINSAVEVDLFGQVNADSINGRQLAGVGGLPNFVQGARMSEGGRSIIVLPSMSDNGRFSRIVAAIPSSCNTAIARQDADYVVSEYGVAVLRGLSVHARAEALIAIAHPEQRDHLASTWSAMMAGL